MMRAAAAGGQRAALPQPMSRASLPGLSLSAAVVVAAIIVLLVFESEDGAPGQYQSPPPPPPPASAATMQLRDGARGAVRGRSPSSHGERKRTAGRSSA